MSHAFEKTMFEVYREPGYGRRFKVVYFTELKDENRDFEISRALSGDHVYDGFFLDRSAGPAKEIIERFLARLNAGESLDSAELRTELAPYAPAE